MKIKLLPQLLIGLFILLFVNDSFAQKPGKEDPKDPKTANTNKNGNTGNTATNGKDPKDAKSQPASAKSNNEVSDKMLANLENLSREEKNTMTTCPMHGTQMSLSDNYRANASDYRESKDFPFAYQLNYRRHCNKCTAALEAEDRAIAKSEQRDANEPVNERCQAHNESMFVNGEHRPIDYEKNPSSDSPYAPQYGFKYYCKTCAKIYKIQHKNEKEEQ